MLKVFRLKSVIALSSAAFNFLHGQPMSRKSMTDILIAGGGLAGSAVAIQLGRMGLSVELFERGDFPKEKPCGEGLMPAGVAGTWGY